LKFTLEGPLSVFFAAALDALLGAARPEAGFVVFGMDSSWSWTAMVPNRA
jgi:hypothetical protein